MRIRLSPQHISVIRDVSDQADEARGCTEELMVFKIGYAKSIANIARWIRLARSKAKLDKQKWGNSAPPTFPLHTRSSPTACPLLLKDASTRLLADMEKVGPLLQKDEGLTDYSNQTFKTAHGCD